MNRNSRVYENTYKNLREIFDDLTKDLKGGNDYYIRIYAGLFRQIDREKNRISRLKNMIYFSLTPPPFNMKDLSYNQMFHEKNQDFNPYSIIYQNLDMYTYQFLDTKYSEKLAKLFFQIKKEENLTNIFSTTEEGLLSKIIDLYMNQEIYTSTLRKWYSKITLFFFNKENPDYNQISKDLPEFLEFNKNLSALSLNKGEKYSLNRSFTKLKEKIIEILSAINWKNISEDKKKLLKHLSLHKYVQKDNIIQEDVIIYVDDNSSNPLITKETSKLSIILLTFLIVLLWLIAAGCMIYLLSIKSNNTIIITLSVIGGLSILFLLISLFLIYFSSIPLLITLLISSLAYIIACIILIFI